MQGLRAVFDTLRPRLVSFRGERGGELFDLPDAPRPDADVPAPVRLLPEWDNAIVGRADARLLPPQHRSAVFQPGLRVLATVLVDGVVVGTWKIERRKTAAVLNVIPVRQAAGAGSPRDRGRGRGDAGSSARRMPAPERSG